MLNLVPILHENTMMFGLPDDYVFLRMPKSCPGVLGLNCVKFQVSHSCDGDVIARMLQLHY